ncbi:MAG: hypothetical protein RR497_03090 [Oscillospiraceae bacterium]
MKTTTRSNKFKWILIGLSSILTVGIIVFLIGLWSYLADFEKNTPQNAVLDYVDLLKNEQYDKAFEVAGYKEDKSADLQGFTNYIKEQFESGYSDIKAYDSTTSKSEHKEYEVYAAKKKALKIGLVESGELSRHKFPKYKIRILGIEPKKHEVIAPSDISIFSNGVLQKPSETVATLPGLKLFDAINDEKKRPTMQKFDILTTFDNPLLVAKRADGSEVAVKSIKNENSVVVYVDISEELINEYSNMALDFSKNYAAFVSNDLKFKELAKDILKETSYYTDMSGYYGGWYLKHNSHSYENLKASNLTLYNDNAFTVDVDFTYVIKRDAKAYNYDTKYTVCYVKDEGNWKVANLVVR